MRGVILLGLTLAMVVALPVKAASSPIDTYRSWSAERRVGYAQGAIDAAFVIAKDVTPEGYQLMQKCLAKKSSAEWAQAIDNLWMRNKPAGRWEYMELPELMLAAYERLCTR